MSAHELLTAPREGGGHGGGGWSYCGCGWVPPTGAGYGPPVAEFAKHLAAMLEGAGAVVAGVRVLVTDPDGVLVADPVILFPLASGRVTVAAFEVAGFPLRVTLERAT